MKIAAWIFICSIVFLQLTRLGRTQMDFDEPLAEGDPENVTEIAPMIRRRPSVRAGSSSRLALMNSRFSRRPRKKHLAPEQLLEHLGDYFEPDWMSVDQPPEISSKTGSQNESYVVYRNGWPYKELLHRLENINLTVELKEVGGGEIAQDPNAIAILEKWLVRRASCPVRYVWEDIGSMFWPRWIRRGECAGKQGACSWPPGMHCVPSGTTTLHILRWQCRLPKGKGRRRPVRTQSRREWKKNENEQLNLKCHWIRVPYPITSECLCTC